MAGAVASLALPPFAFGWAAIPATATLVVLARRAGARGALGIGAWFGVAAFGLELAWVSAFGWLAWVPLVLLSAVFTALGAASVASVWRAEHPLRSAIATAGAWTAVDFLRGSWPLGGLTWGSLASTQVDLPLARLLPYVGTWGATFAVALAAALLADAWERGRAGARTPLALAVLVAVGPIVLPFASATGPSLDVATLQVDVRSARPLGGAGEDLAVAAAHAQLHRTLAGDRVDLIVWGEGSLDPAAARDPSTMALVADAVRSVGTPTLVGAVDRNAADEEQTSVLLYDGTGQRVGRYAKVHLVPFGEYVPWRSRLGFIEELEQIPVDRVPGRGPRTLAVDGVPPFGAPICFENAFPAIGRAMVDRGARFFVLTINNASYGLSSASEQHLIMSRLLAMETGRWVVHAAISGITAFIEPTGRVVASRGLFVPGITRATIATSTGRTPAVRLDDATAWACVVIAALGVLAPPSRRRRRGAPEPLPATARTLVILPTYDEAATIGEVLDRLLALPDRVEVLVVDDASPDGTGAIVAERAARDPRVRLREREGKLGLATAYLLGFREALDGGYDLVVEMDSDLSHRPEDLPGILAAARDGLDLAIGSRYVPGGGVTDWSRGRLALSRAGNTYARACLGMAVRDATSGFRAYRRGALEAILARPVRSDGYAFQVELARRVAAEGGEIGEVPITFAERAAGASKMSRRIVVEALVLVTAWGLRERLRPWVPASRAQRP
ncbi:MAG: apolipoprotein N-acyltransferase [Actinomycetota bacterium]